jgi:uncharacterized protein YkwD
MLPAKLEGSCRTTPRAACFLVLLGLGCSACTSTPQTMPDPWGTDSSSLSSSSETYKPWVPAVVRAMARDRALDEAAAVLCARGTDAVIDDEVRAKARVWDARIMGVMAESAVQATAKVEALFVGAGYSHVGLAQGSRSGGGECFAVVGARRLVAVAELPPAATMDTRRPSSLSLSLSPRRRGQVFVLGPDGLVDRIVVDGITRSQTIELPSRRAGRYVLELIVDEIDDEGQEKGRPEVALWWPYVRGDLRLAPAPSVLFPDDGHDDTALSHRAEALVQRLRNEQLLEPLKISPVLTTLAVERASALGPALGHVIDGDDPKKALATRFGDDPRARFVRLAEVQARGSTLDDAWQALVDSPAHRYELVALGVTHLGIAVVRGQDAVGREQKTLVALLGRRPLVREHQAVQKKILDDTNAVRLQRGLDLVVVSDTLEATAMRLARRMQETSRVDDTLLGGPVGEVALEADASLTRVQPLVARIDDPLLLGSFSALVDMDTTAIGVGLSLHPTEGVFYVCVLAGSGG